MQQHSRWDNDTYIIKLSGKLMGGPDNTTFHDDVKSVVNDGCRKLVIDMNEVDWLNSWGVGLLVSAFTTLRSSGGRMILVGCMPKVMTVLRMTHFDSVFSFDNDVPTAVHTLAAP